MTLRAKKNGIAIALSATMLLGASLAHADSRFGNDDGGAMGGIGSLGQGSVTVHHNLLPEKEQELRNTDLDLQSQIDQMRSEHAAALAKMKADLQKEIDKGNEWKLGEGQNCKAYVRDGSGILAPMRAIGPRTVTSGTSQTVSSGVYSASYATMWCLGGVWNKMKAWSDDDDNRS